MGNKVSLCFGQASSDEAPESSLPSVQFGLHGSDVDLDGLRLSGKGTALASASLLQDRAYWEMKVVKPGSFAFGVARKSGYKLSSLGYDENSWALRCEGEEYRAGDVIAAAFDQGDVPTALRFYHNGNLIEQATIKGIRGEVYPAISVSDAVIEVQFDGNSGFAYPPPAGFSGVMASQRLM